MEQEWGEGFVFYERTDECFDGEADDGAQAELVVAVVPLGFQHFGKAPGHRFLVVHRVEVADDSQLDAAAEGLDEVAGEAGAIAAEFVDEADGAIQAAGQALPFDCVVKKAVAVVERGVQRRFGAALFASEEVLGDGIEEPRPKEAGVAGLQAEDAREGIISKPWHVCEEGVEDAEHGVLIADFGKDEIAGELGGASLGEGAEGGEGTGVHMPGAWGEGEGAPFLRRFIPPRHDDGALRGEALQCALRPPRLRGEALHAAECLDGDFTGAGNQPARLNVEVRVVVE